MTQRSRRRAAALASAEQVVPLFVFDPAVLARSASANRLAFLLEALADLDARLSAPPAVSCTAPARPAAREVGFFLAIPCLPDARRARWSEAPLKGG